MYPDGARQMAAGHHRVPWPGGPCQCHSCARRDPPPDPRRYGMAVAGPAPPRRHHPDDRRRLTPSADGVGGRALGADGAGGHRSPQRRPVFVAPGPYPGLPGHLGPWDPRPAQWTHPGARERPGAGHYPSVQEQCSCVWRGGAGGPPFNGAPSHTFNGGPPQPLPPPPPEYRGQGDGRRRTAGRVAERGVGEEEEEEKEVEKEEKGLGEEGEGPRTGWERPSGSDRRRLEPRAGRPRTPPSYLHVPNGHSGRRVCSEGRGEGGDKHRERSRKSKRAPEEGGGYSALAGAPHRGFFSTEVPQKHLNHSRRKGPPRAPSPSPPPPPAAPHSQEPALSPGQDPPRGRDSDPAGQGTAGPGSTVHHQIRQVITNLEDVLGGLKQVHLEMKEVVDQIDRLTAHMDLGDESLAITEPADYHVPPRPGVLCAAPAPHHKPLRSNAPSPVHVACVVKTNRVPPPGGPAKDAGRKWPQPAANGHLPHLCPPRDSDPQDPWRRAPVVPGAPGAPGFPGVVPGVTVGSVADSRASGARTQKPPPYPQNGKCGKGAGPAKGPGPPPIPAKTQTPYPGRRRQSTSMV